jgi:hypothetical protein
MARRPFPVGVLKKILKCQELDSVEVLPLGWNSPWEVSILVSNQFFIHTDINNSQGDLCSITFIYGHPVLSHRKHIWEELESIAKHAHPKWLCIGDFNQVLVEEDKFSFKPSSLQGNFDLLQTLSNVSLIPIESKGLSHTWMNKRQVDHFVMEKLDSSFWKY